MSTWTPISSTHSHAILPGRGRSSSSTNSNTTSTNNNNINPFNNINYNMCSPGLATTAPHTVTLFTRRRILRMWILLLFIGASIIMVHLSLDYVLRVGDGPLAPDLRASSPSHVVEMIQSETKNQDSHNVQSSQSLQCPSLPTTAAGFDGVSLVTAVMNRNDRLAASLVSWLQIKDIKEIVIVDWSSQPPARDAVLWAVRNYTDSIHSGNGQEIQGKDEKEGKQREGLTTRIKLITVPGQPEWVITRACNLAAFHSSGSRILKVDSDVAFDTDFVAQHPLLTPAQAEYVLDARNTWTNVTSAQERQSSFDATFFNSPPAHSRGAHQPVNVSLIPSFKQRNGYFYSGDWVKARNENERHLNGVFYATREAFFKVRGYDERITTYGWDDDNLYTRFEYAGFNRVMFNMNTLRHIQHGDEQRLGNQGKEQVISVDQSRQVDVETFTDVEILKNEEMIKSIPHWGQNDAGMTCAMSADDRDHATDKANTLTSCVCQPASYGKTLQDVLSPEKYDSMLQVAQRRVLSYNGNLPAAYLSSTTNSAKLHSLLQLYFPGQPRYLIIHAQHGLGNRMRAVASARVLAGLLGRRLRVIWVPDEHCNATFTDLFEPYWGTGDDFTLLEQESRLQKSLLSSSSLSQLSLLSQLSPVDVWSEFDPRELSASHVDIYNYMEPEPGAKKEAPIHTATWKHIYVKSAYQLVSSVFKNKSAAEMKGLFQQALRAMVPTQSVRDILRGLMSELDEQNKLQGGEQQEQQQHQEHQEQQRPQVVKVGRLVGMHIRNLAPTDTKDISHLKENTYSAQGMNALETHRKSCLVDHFVARARQIMAKTPGQRFYVSADDPKTYRMLTDAFGRFGHLGKGHGQSQKQSAGQGQGQMQEQGGEGGDRYVVDQAEVEGKVDGDESLDDVGVDPGVDAGDPGVDSGVDADLVSNLDGETVDANNDDLSRRQQSTASANITIDSINRNSNSSNSNINSNINNSSISNINNSSISNINNSSKSRSRSIMSNTITIAEDNDNENDGRIMYLGRTCTDRGAACLGYALADIVMLSRTKWVVGSVWSSFTEVAVARGGNWWENGCQH